MKKLLLIFVVVLSGNFNEVLAWDSTAAKYLPLQVGNTWTYSGSASSAFMYGRSYQTYKVTGILDSLGKRYYTIQYRLIMISGTLGAGVWQLSNPIRIDSVTMNVYKLSPNCNSTETLMDSLRAHINDTTFICYYQFFISNSKCIDTSSYNIFNNSYPSKRFSEFFGPGYGTIYVKGIGIVISDYGYSMNQVHDTLRGCVINGVLYGDTNTIVGINQISSETPNNFSLSQNYPNPFNPGTSIKFQIAKSSNAKLIIYDALGKEVETLIDKKLEPGEYESDFDGTNLPSGIYFYKLEAGAYTETKKMVLIK